MNDPQWIFEIFERNCEQAFTETLILINAKLARLELIKPLTIQIADVHQVPYYRLKTLIHQLMANTVFRLFTGLDQRIDFYDQRPSQINDRWYRHGFDLPIKRAQQHLTHELIITGDFAVNQTSQTFVQIVHLYCKITRRIIQFLRQEEPDPDDPDGFFKVHFQPLMEGVLVIELDKIAELLQRYQEN